MNESKVEYAILNVDKCVALVWKTNIGRVVVVEEKIDANGDLSIYDIKEGKTIDNIDLRNLLLEILPKEK